MIALLKLTYEIEGLILLLNNRGEGAPIEIKELLCEKVKSLSSLTDNLFTDEISSDTSTQEIEEAIFPHDDLTAEEEEIASNVLFEETSDADCPKEIVEEIADEPMDTEVEIADVPMETEVEIANESENTAPLTLDEKLARDQALDLTKAFTLNDKFRFIRFLFNNSEADYKEALEVLSTMNGIDEAEEYIFDDLCWDPDNEDVKDFMDIISNHF